MVTWGRCLCHWSGPSGRQAAMVCFVAMSQGCLVTWQQITAGCKLDIELTCICCHLADGTCDWSSILWQPPGYTNRNPYGNPCTREDLAIYIAGLVNWYVRMSSSSTKWMCDVLQQRSSLLLHFPALSAVSRATAAMPMNWKACCTPGHLAHNLSMTPCTCSELYSWYVGATFAMSTLVLVTCPAAQRSALAHV